MSTMTETSSLRPKAVSESKRQRDVFRFFPQRLRGQNLSLNLEQTQELPPPDHVPISSKDQALTAFAQLGAIRLGASRALVSLIDSHTQHVLAEATPTLPLRSSAASRSIAAEQLWLGNVSIARDRGICEELLNLRPHHGNDMGSKSAVVINDLTLDERFAQRSMSKNGVKFRFYAGVPLMSPDGAIIGAYSIFDEEPRDGLSNDHLILLQDLSATVMEHMATYKVRQDHERAGRMVKGLTSFVEGASTLHPQPVTHQLSSSFDTNLGGHPEPAIKSNDVSPCNVQQDKRASPHKIFKYLNEKGSLRHEMGMVKKPASILARQQSYIAQLQENILPKNTKSMFGRAANIIREASELDGVVIFDASVAARRGDRRQRSHGSSRKGSCADSDGDSPTRSKKASKTPKRQVLQHETSASESASSIASELARSASNQRPQMSQILGYSTTSETSFTGDQFQIGDLPETDLRRLLNMYSQGKILNFNSLGEGTTSEDTGSDSSPPPQDGLKPRVVHVDTIQTVLPGAKSVAFLPLWDYERSRWFAVCLCWTTYSDRLLSTGLDLVYLKAFGNSIMVELSRLDEIATNRMKTTFVASISHELRSPLHGILGSVEFMQDTSLDAFQASLLHSISTCGRTLLETLDHILDHAKVNEFSGKGRSVTRQSVIKMKDASSVSMLAKQPRTTRKKLAEMTNLVSSFDIGLALEEVVEAVFAGQSYRVLIRSAYGENIAEEFANNTFDKLQGDSSDPDLESERKVFLLILDIPYRKNWRFNTLAGAWRRILMNVVGNAIKFTDSGFVQVSLRTEKTKHQMDSSDTQVTISVSDSGIGISQEFLANRLYTPFSQENTFSPGTGLGLSIVRQIVESLGGRIDLKSEPKIGTEVTVQLTLPEADAGLVVTPDGDLLASIIQRMRGRNICILEPALIAGVSSAERRGAEQFAKTLATTLTDWLRIPVQTTSEWEGSSVDLVICTEPSFGHLASIRRKRAPGGKAPMTVFLAADAIEAATLRDDARVSSKESVVEILTQPCGPHKLAKLLDHCLTRFESSTENGAHVATLPLTPPEEYAAKEHQAYFALNPNVTVKPPSISIDRAASGLPQSLNVLITDDNPINRRLLTTLMKKSSFQYQQAENGLQALNLYKSAPKPFDVILMDLSMPIMDGMTATKRIRAYEKSKGIPRTTVIALTGLASASARLEAMGSGIDYYLTKPVSFAKLMGFLLPMVGGKREDAAGTSGSTLSKVGKD